MPIIVQCACGGKFQAKDELAGKRLNCPSCKSPIQVPDPRATRPAPQPTGGAIAVQCQCGQKFKAKSEMAGKKVKCPKCQSQMKIPGGPATPSTSSQQPSAGAGKRNVQCKCGQVYSVPATMAGRAVKCQKCGAGMKVPGGAPAPSQPQAAAAAPLDDPLGVGDLGGMAGGDLFADDPLGGDFGDDALGGAAAATTPAFQPGGYQPTGAAQAPAAGGSKMNLPLIIGLASGGGVLVLLLICGIAGYSIFFTSGGPVAVTTDDGSSVDGSSVDTDGANPSPRDTPITETTDGAAPETLDGETPESTDGEIRTEQDPPSDATEGDPAQNGDLAKDILGYWKLVLVDGEKTSPSTVGYMNFTDATMVMLDVGAPAASISYSLDATQSPAHFDIIPVPNSPVRLKGLARIKDNRLELCMLQRMGDRDLDSLADRPKSFESVGGYSVLTAERVSDPDLIAQLQGGAKPPAGPVVRNYLNDGKQFALAAFNYHDVNQKWPRNVVNQQGEVLLSWRVQLLPFLEHNSMYDQFDREASWDQPGNKAFASQTDLYRLEYSKSPAETTWRYIPDTKTGIMLVLGSEDAPQVIWTQPDEIHPDLNNLKATFGTPPEEGYVVVLTNGASQRMSEEDLKAALAKAETWDMKGKPR